ncbi:hypothetical protein EA462_05875 [Natrarchaeobius halalkaliphilus]|uniref:DNA-3-methyladenine glycosylase 2 family protein n=1 Tax=Natrarchaeobius halalkaliphilus TaxID=1679091 RepID=A0A3N6M6K7_9EURY|nr:hypothetical protein [Natrarchaeobius halalkaliphilus]RQG91720.1 hypothetical protein EA462_05875 [Natrarchaeobius halalkaliphilus]
MNSVQSVLDRYAGGTPYERLTRQFLEFDRWSGDDPLLLVAETAVATTGQRSAGGRNADVSEFRDAFVATGRVDSFETLAGLESEDAGLSEVFAAARTRRVLLEVASVLSARPEADDLAALRGWAGEADQYRYDEDPIGSISGIGPSSFQYLRQLAGMDVAAPDATVSRFVDTVDTELESATLETTSPLLTIASCEWLAIVSAYSPIEIDRIAWWTFADEDERQVALS